MRKKITLAGPALAMAAALTAGLVVGTGGGQTPTRAKLAASSATEPFADLDSCPALTMGYHGGCVDQLQTELNDADHATLGVDGTFGAATKQAVITFQQQNGVSPADGIVGPQTKQALVNAGSVPTPTPGAPLSPFEICQQKDPGSVSDGHGGKECRSR